MLTNQENKNIAISGLITFLVFLIFYLFNYQTLSESNLSNLKIFSYIPLKINLFFTYIILPTLIFIFLQNVLLKYITFLWATSISTLSVLSYSGYDFKRFLFDLFFDLENINLIKEKKIILFENPNISIFVLLFLLLVLICFKVNRFNLTQIFAITFFWSIFSFYSLSGSVIGFIFWNLYSAIRVFRLKKSLYISIMSGLANLIFFVIFIFLFKNFLSIEVYNIDGIYKFTLNYFLFYFLGPVISILIIYFFYKIDIYEIIIKFLPIYILMFADFIVSIYLAKSMNNYQNFEYFAYPHFILHFLYIIPIIYYLSRPPSPFVENKKNKINTMKNYIYIFFNNISKFYLPMMILFLILFLFLPGKI